MVRKKKQPADKVEPGMVVETTQGNIGEEDVSKPKVTEVVKDQQGHVEKVIVSKGVLFQKKIEVPAERIEAVDQPAADTSMPAAKGTKARKRAGMPGQAAKNKEATGKVTVTTHKGETELLTAAGTQELVAGDEEGVLDTVEKTVLTAEGVREMEASNVVASATGEGPQPSQEEEQAVGAQLQKPHQKAGYLLRILGPGFLTGMAGNDSSAVGAYSVDGATNGYGHLWLMLLSTPLYFFTQFACAKIGRITQKGLSEILSAHYGRPVAVLASFILIIANVALISADLVAIGSGLQLITGLFWVWFIVPIAATLWYLTVYRNFETLKKIFIGMSLAFAAYFVTAIFSGANWHAVLLNTFVPHVDLSFASISSAVALLGATISPYTLFWQVQGEKEQKRRGTIRQKVRSARLDIAIGIISGNLVSYFIIVCTSATLFAHHQNIATAADAARSLQPLLGPGAKYLFAIGFIGAGLVAVPILLASTSYAVAGTFGWPYGLSKMPWQSEGFYLILTTALFVSMAIAMLRLDPIRLIFWANVLSGVLSPVLVVFLFLVGNNRKIMRDRRLGLPTNIALALTGIVMAAAAVLLFYGLATGQGS